jgi:hypothetical protein
MKDFLIILGMEDTREAPSPYRSLIFKNTARTYILTYISRTDVIRILYINPGDTYIFVVKAPPQRYTYTTCTYTYVRFYTLLTYININFKPLDIFLCAVGASPEDSKNLLYAFLPSHID